MGRRNEKTEERQGRGNGQRGSHSVLEDLENIFFYSGNVLTYSYSSHWLVPKPQSKPLADLPTDPPTTL